MKNFIFTLFALISSTLMAGPFDSYTSDQAAKNAPSSGSGDGAIQKSFDNIFDKGIGKIAGGFTKEDDGMEILAPMIGNELTKEERKFLAQQQFLKAEIKKSTSIIEALKSKMSFLKKTKKIFLKKSGSYIDIYVPYNNQTNISFDQDIKEMSFLSQEGVTIQKKSNTNNQLEILNKSPNLLINIKITFVSDKEVTLVLQTGESGTDRYVAYDIFSDESSLATKTLFLSPARIKTIHNDFNNKALLLILSRLTKNEFYKKLRENIETVNKVLFSGHTSLNGIHGLTDVNYDIILNNVFESPFVKSTDKGSKEKRRLILMELTIKNNSINSTLTVNEVLLKNRFGNMVASWMGNLELKENILSPKSSRRVLLVIEDKFSSKFSEE